MMKKYKELYFYFKGKRQEAGGRRQESVEITEEKSKI
jgi:hypothetical protein